MHARAHRGPAHLPHAVRRGRRSPGILTRALALALAIALALALALTLTLTLTLTRTLHSNPHPHRYTEDIFFGDAEEYFDVGYAEEVGCNIYSTRMKRLA